MTSTSPLPHATFALDFGPEAICLIKKKEKLKYQSLAPLHEDLMALRH